MTETSVSDDSALWGARKHLLAVFSEMRPEKFAGNRFLKSRKGSEEGSSNAK